MAGGKAFFQDIESKSDLIRYRVSSLFFFFFYCEQALLPNSNKLSTHSLKHIVTFNSLLLQKSKAKPRLTHQAVSTMIPTLHFILRDRVRTSLCLAPTTYYYLALILPQQLPISPLTVPC